MYAEGLQELRRSLEGEEEMEVFVVAPEHQRSAASHAITLHKPLYVYDIRIEGAKIPMWAVSGTPADCTKMGVLALLDRAPDIVVSGINRGPNLGMDVLYSGTVSAAIEASILGLPALAVSLATFEEADYGFAALFTRRLLGLLRRHPLPPGAILNINIPALEPSDIAGVEVTRLGVRYYRDVFHPRVDPRGRRYYWLAGEVQHGEDEGTDIAAVEKNLISITPIHLRITDEGLFPSLEKLSGELAKMLEDY